MKTLISIPLLGLLLYNSMGYYITYYFQSKNSQMEINRDVNKGKITQKDLLVFKVALPSYHHEDKDFERIEGDFVFEDKVYEMVKQKLTNDTLYVYCINNIEKEELRLAFGEHTQATLGHKNVNNTAKPEKVNFDFLKDYLPKHTSYTANLNFIPLQSTYTFYSLIRDSIKKRIPTPPPRFC